MIDINKKYRTRDGKEVRIYATDGAGDWPVHGAVKEELGWIDVSWTKEGYSLTSAKNLEDDLIEINEQQELLEEAKRRYPKGNQVKCLRGWTSAEVAGRNPSDGIITSDRVTNLLDHDESIWFDTKQFMVCVYDEGQWAEKVKEHEVEIWFYINEFGFIETSVGEPNPSDIIAIKKITFYEGEGL